MSLTATTVNLYPQPNYEFLDKEPHYERDHTVERRLLRLKNEYQERGMRRSVECVLVIHEYNHPHVLLLQLGQHFFKLPGGELRPGESEQQGTSRLLTDVLCAENSPIVNWEIIGSLGTWWRPNFEALLYPYVCSHVTKPKEQKKILLIQVPESYTFVIPRNCSIIAVPLFMLYSSNSQKYGPIISSLPVSLSQYNFVFNQAAGSIPSSDITTNQSTDQNLENEDNPPFTGEDGNMDIGDDLE